MIDLSVIVVTWETRELVLECLRSVEASLGPDAGAPVREYEVFVVDNGSRDGSAEAVRNRHPSVCLIALPENRGFARACNVALRLARGRFVLLLNSDARLSRDAVARSLAALDAAPDAGVAGVQLLHPDGRLQNSVHSFPGLRSELIPVRMRELLWPRRLPSKRRGGGVPVDVDAVLGAALFARRRAIEAVGLLCEDYFFFLEETDWCWRMQRAGWRVLHVPDARLVHVSGASSKRRHPAATRIEFHRSLYRFLARHRRPSTRRLVVALRALRALGTLLANSPMAPFSRAARARCGSRARLLLWHLLGCPAGAGLASLPPYASGDERPPSPAGRRPR